MELLIVVLLSEQVENAELYLEEYRDMENEAHLEWLLTHSLLTILNKNRRFIYFLLRIRFLHNCLQ